MAVGDFESIADNSKTTINCRTSSSYPGSEPITYMWPMQSKQNDGGGAAAQLGMSSIDEELMARQVDSILLNVLEDESIANENFHYHLQQQKANNKVTNASPNDFHYALSNSNNSRFPINNACGTTTSAATESSVMSTVVEQLVQLQLVQNGVPSAAVRNPSPCERSKVTSATSGEVRSLQLATSPPNGWSASPPTNGGTTKPMLAQWSNSGGSGYSQSSFDSGYFEDDLLQLQHPSAYSNASGNLHNSYQYLAPRHPNSQCVPGLVQNGSRMMWTGMPLPYCYDIPVVGASGSHQWLPVAMNTFPRPVVTPSNVKSAASRRNNYAAYELHLSVDECLEEFRLLEKERKKTEADLARHNLGKKISSANTLPIPRLTQLASKVDRLIVDYFREHARVVTLFQKMEWLRGEPLKPNILNAIQAWFVCIKNAHVCRVNERAYLLYTRGVVRYSSEDRQLMHLASLLKATSRATKRARSAMACALKMTLNKDPNSEQQQSLSINGVVEQTPNGVSMTTPQQTAVENEVGDLRQH